MYRLLTVFMTALFMTIPLQSQAVTFKIATIAPDGTAWMEKMRAGADEIARRTDDRVKFRFYPGGVMGSDKAVLRKIRVGQLQGGAVTGGGLAEIYPDANIYSLPFAFRSYDEVDYVRQRMDPLLLKDLEDRGFISFGFGENGFAYLMSEKPIHGVNDLRGKKVWIPEGDRISRVAFESLGVSPISLPLTDVLTALQTGLVDTIGSSTVGAVALQWYTEVRYVTDLPLMYLYGSLVIKQRDFQRLSAQDQTVVREVMGKVARELDHQGREDNRSARQALINQGIEFVAPTAEQGEHWRKKVDESVERLAEEGVFTRRMLEILHGYLADYRRSAK